MTFSTLISCWKLVEKDFLSNDFKLCFLLNDEILIETLGEQTVQNILERNAITLNTKSLQIFTDIVIPLKNKVPDEIIHPYGVLDMRGYPRWGKNYMNFTYPDPKSSSEYAHNILLKEFQEEWGITEIEGIDVEQLEGAARAYINTVELWSRTNQELPCTLEANKGEKSAMKAMNAFKPEENVSITPTEIFQMSVPSFENVSWEKVIEFKKNYKLKSLRDKILEVSKLSGNDINKAQTILKDLETKATEEIIEENRPSIKKVVFETLLSNIPGIPLINPFGIYLNGRDVINEIKDNKEYNWVYTLRDVRKINSR